MRLLALSTARTRHPCAAVVEFSAMLPGALAAFPPGWVQSARGVAASIEGVPPLTSISPCGSAATRSPGRIFSFLCSGLSALSALHPPSNNASSRGAARRRNVLDVVMVLRTASSLRRKWRQIFGFEPDSHRAFSFAERQFDDASAGACSDPASPPAAGVCSVDPSLAGAGAGAANWPSISETISPARIHRSGGVCASC